MKELVAIDSRIELERQQLERERESRERMARLDQAMQERVKRTANG
jgi:hypothetical protein